MSTQFLHKRSITPNLQRKDDSSKNATSRQNAQEVQLPPRKPSSATVQDNFPLLASLLLTCLPTIYLYSLERSRHGHHQQRIDLRILIWTYILTGTVGITVAMAVQSVLAYLLALLCFHGHTTAMSYLAETMKTTEDDIKALDEAHRRRRHEMARRRGYWVFMLLFSFLAAGLVEEGIKYIAIRTAMLALAQQQRSSHTGKGVSTERDNITIAVSAALGFATAENIAFLFAAARGRKGSGAKDSRQDTTFVLLTAVERVVLGITGHATTAALIGVNMLIRDHHLNHYHHHHHHHHTLGRSTTSISMNPTLWLILRDPALFHGFFNFMLFAVSALEGHVGWVHPRKPRTVCFVLAFAVGMQAALALVLRERLRLVGLW
ncbi:uncharacterized protein Z520_09897 [Fonsecaea multimorphosa CBS 102226]|uniref:Uncharacterized protein n=1 Tax=Fonsecaea multimorphosa CBS 102226 TaxID=1442371 RepID=A0A0D2IBI9_9EURO|nr:uncharacterized protein Z520_09897 [Fonsecaea multimorphosa CBS 102226]KIX94511.1 hypothetical protein Z520_09897 [Fonsecaea multimorphosa CBS 102226]OAL20089.1 hypothetical protein AYO22_09239 [Fonsecaea multimorphosa]